MEFNAIIDAITYIAKKLNKADKLKIIKLLYLSDKYHLSKYGRTITGDDYLLTKDGPVGTLAKDILDTNDFLQEETNNNLSKTDIEALDYVIRKFGKKEATELKAYIRRYPECKKQQGSIQTIDMLSKIDNDQLLQDIPEDHIKETKEFLLGYF